MSRAVAPPKRQSLAESRRPRGPKRARTVPNFLPPEGVPLHFVISGLGSRFAAQVTDILLTVGPVIAVLLMLYAANVEMGDGWYVLFVLLFFFVRTPYYIATELLWNGQTVGKRIAGLRVVSASGGSLRAHSVVVRNVMKEMEVFAPGTYLIAVPILSTPAVLLICVWVLVLLMVPLMNERRQRLGDLAADTIVVRQPRAVLLPDLAAEAAETVRERFTFATAQLDHYGNYELQTLERVLHAGPPYPSREVEKRHLESLVTISAKIRDKIGYADNVPERDVRDVLQAFYRAQRAHLESRRLFGDTREDKFHGEIREAPR